MTETNLINMKSELEDEERAFSSFGVFNIKHEYTEKEDTAVNSVEVNGRKFVFTEKLTFKDGVLEKRLIKRFAKLAVYKAISETCGKSLPWGSLTGVRPTKLAYTLLSERGEFTDYFKNVLSVSEKKTDLTAAVIESQKGVYQENCDGSDFFVFIPFCPSRCAYCSFISHDLKFAYKYEDAYVDALVKEIEYSARYVKKLRSIYVGGGTPVAIKNENLEKILSAIDKINCGAEFTVEAGRPDAIRKDNLDILKAHGVTRICVNPQTFSDKTLKIIGRNHTAEDIFRAYDLARNDFSVNMDIIAGLPEERFSDFENTLNTVLSLSPDDITVHTLCLKRGSALMEKGSGAVVGETRKMVDFAEETLVKSGYFPYYLYRQKYMSDNLENVGYCKKDKRCVFNIDTMEEICSTVACGAFAVNKRVFNGGDRIERYGNPKDVKTYLNNFSQVSEKKDALFCE